MGLPRGSRRSVRAAPKAAINGVLTQSCVFIKNSPLEPMVLLCIETRIAALEFESANPTVVKSIKQRDLLNTWMRLYARQQLMPRIEEYQPERLAGGLPDLGYYTLHTAQT